MLEDSILIRTWQVSMREHNYIQVEGMSGALLISMYH